MIEAKNKLCPSCKRELTDKETELKTKTCWFCLAKVLKDIGETAQIPDPEEYGRPGALADLAREEKLEAIRSINDSKDITDAAADIKPVVSEEERKKMIVEFGIDPNAKTPVTVITVKGKNDDTYLQLSLRGKLSPEMRNEFEKWLKGMLELVGTVATFGPNFASTILNMKMMSPEMFLKS